MGWSATRGRRSSKLRLKPHSQHCPLPIAPGSELSGLYDSIDVARSDVENSLFTNLVKTMPNGFMRMSFERGSGALPVPPAAIELIGGQLHYYRYLLDGGWSTWEADKETTL